MTTLPDTIVSGDENQQIFLVKPTYSSSGYTFADQRVLNTTYRFMEWFYQRNGGCGSFKLILKENFTEGDTALLEGWEIHVRIKLSGETTFTTWYRGVIKDVERRIVGSETTTEIRGQGYIDELVGLEISRRYPAGQRVDQIVGDLLNNYIKPYTRIIKPSDVSITEDTGIDSSSYVTQGPIHFECSIVRALKFLAELQGSREFGVSASRAFYFRAKATTFTDGLFQTKDLVDIIDAGRSSDKINKLTVNAKQWGHSEQLTTGSDTTDITNYGTAQRTMELPWVEHNSDALQWANNVIAARKAGFTWKQVTWNEATVRLERNHPDSSMGMVRIYGTDISNDFDDLDINNIHYIKGAFEARLEVNDLGHPKPAGRNKSTLLRAIVTAGMHQYSLSEELEEKVISQIEAIKGRHKQFQNPNVDVTLPNSGERTLKPGEVDGLYSNAGDVTNSRIELNYFDNQEFKKLVGMRAGDVTNNVTGNFPGEEFFCWTDVPTRSVGEKYYWTGSAWRLI